MAATDPRIDAYIAKSADFAKPVLNHIRRIVHRACPAVEETIKWGFPHFMHKGILCSMAAFKEHCALGFWRHKLIFNKAGQADRSEEMGMGQFGRITSVSDLPKGQTLLAYIKEAVRLNHEGIKPPPKAQSKERKPLVVPADLASALARNKKAQATFDKFSYSHKKEYAEWITEAKRAETRQRRIETAIEWMGAGKSRNWKYANC